MTTTQIEVGNRLKRVIDQLSPEERAYLLGRAEATAEFNEKEMKKTNEEK